MNGYRPPLWLSILLGVACPLGCVSQRHLIDQARLSYWNGNFVDAEKHLEQARKRARRDQDLLKLDHAMISFSQGDLLEARDLLRESRDRFDSPPAAVQAQNSASFLLDDNARPYLGEDYEKLLVRVLLTLIELVDDQGDALAYAHQLGISIDDMLAHRPGPEAAENLGQEESATHAAQEPDAPAQATPDIVKEELAIGPLLRALVRQSQRIHHDEVVRNLKVATEWRATSPFLIQEFLAAAERQELPPQTGRVYLIALVGRGPTKQSTIAPATSQALLIADRLLSALGEYSLPPTIAPVKIAEVVPSTSNVDGLQVYVGGQLAGNTETIADINRLAMAQHEEHLPEIVARAIVRRLVKKSVVVASKAQLGVENDLASTAYNLAGVLWEASEQADLRCWSLLPGQIQILKLDLPIGTHQLVLYPTLQGTLARPDPLTCTVEVLDGKNTFAVGTLLDASQAGSVFTCCR